MVKYVKYVNFSNKCRFCAALIRGRHLFEARCLLKEIRYTDKTLGVKAIDSRITEAVLQTIDSNRDRSITIKRLDYNLESGT